MPEASVQVGAVVLEGSGWVWETSEMAIPETLWSDGSVPVTSPCVVLGSDGLLRGSDICAGGFSARQLRLVVAWIQMTDLCLWNAGEVNRS